MALEGLKRLADDNPARYSDWGVCEILYANISAVYTKVYKSSVSRNDKRGKEKNGESMNNLIFLTIALISDRV